MRINWGMVLLRQEGVLALLDGTADSPPLQLESLKGESR